MSSLTNVNNNAAVVVVGRTAPVPPGQQPASKSIPVVLASNQPTIPVEEQNKIASEVALSLLGIPRSEVALGIFADVNTYDVNPSEWSALPAIRQSIAPSTDVTYAGFAGNQGWGLKHIPEESGALIEAPADKTAVLTSKRFFRYQPGRVSSATFGVKTSVIPGDPSGDVRNPAIRKYGIYDNFDGYYWETRDTGKGDQLVVTRRTTSIIEKNPIPFGIQDGEQIDDYGTVGTPSSTRVTTSADVVAGREYTVTVLGSSLAQWQALFSSLTSLPTIGQRVTASATGTLAGGGLVTQTIDLVVMRDGLIHVHAAVYDPTLLLDERNIAINSINASTDEIQLSSAGGELQAGQHIFYHTNESAAISGLIKGRVYKIFSRTATSGGVYNVKLAQIDGTAAIDLGTLSGSHFLRTPVPFMFPSIQIEGAQDIMWPYKRSFTIDRVNFDPSPLVGYIDTTGGTAPTAATQAVEIKADIDAINSGSVELHWANWVAYNVKPEFYRVYEFRVPRSRFSGDFMDGVADTETSDAQAVYYSDVVRTGSGANTIKRPGQPVINPDTSTNAVKDSVWNLDFTKVVMQKIEFSWYGAVGALFLAYVPISNGEARWIRVHHMRASNQLKVASLGNATLPITYMVYGGGSEQRGGYVNNSDKRVANNFDSSYSQYVTKYGASYYIDGGDRGTVRLYSHSSPVASDVAGSKYRMLVNASQAQSAGTIGDINGGPYITVLDDAPYNNNPVVSDFYMGATVLTSSPLDQGVKVSWIDVTNKRLYLNKALSTNNSSVQLDVLVDRPRIVYGVQTKTTIVSSQGRSVRNRVQVYPTRLATGAFSSTNATVSLQLRKNPIFQTFDSYSGTLLLNAGTNHVLSPAGQPTSIENPTTAPTFDVGSTSYGWFRAYFTSDSNKVMFPVLGLLTRLSNTSFTFTAETSYASEVVLVGSFISAGNYNTTGSTVTSPPASLELERLSSVNIVSDIRTPIPGTGLQVTTFYVQPGGQQFDLSAYFDYNKDYLSFPLTNKVDTLYITSNSVEQNTALDGGGAPTGASITRSSLLASLTWEEQ